MKFTKQIKATPKVATSLVEVEMHDCVSGENLVFLRKKWETISQMKCSIPEPDQHWFDVFHQAVNSLSSADKNFIYKRIRMTFVDRVYHSSDWKEWRYLEKGDINALLAPVKTLFEVVANTKLKEFCGELSSDLGEIVWSRDIIDIYVNFAAFIGYGILLLTYPPVADNVAWLRQHLDLIYLDTEHYERILAALTFAFALEVRKHDNPIQ